MLGQFMTNACSILAQYLPNSSPILAQCLPKFLPLAWPMLGLVSHSRDLGMNSLSFLFEDLQMMLISSLEFFIFTEVGKNVPKLSVQVWRSLWTSQPYLVKSFLILSKTPTSWAFHSFFIKHNDFTTTLSNTWECGLKLIWYI